MHSIVLGRGEAGREGVGRGKEGGGRGRIRERKATLVCLTVASMSQSYSIKPLCMFIALKIPPSPLPSSSPPSPLLSLLLPSLPLPSPPSPSLPLPSLPLPSLPLSSLPPPPRSLQYVSMTQVTRLSLEDWIMNSRFAECDIANALMLGRAEISLNRGLS